MDKKKISGKRKKLRKESTVINGVEFLKHDPSAIFKNHKEIRQALVEALLEGDKEAFVEILSVYVKVHNIAQVCKGTGLSRTVVYEAIGENGNPSLDTLCKIMTSFKKIA